MWNEFSLVVTKEMYRAEHGEYTDWSKKKGQELSGAYKFDNLAQRGIEISKKYFATLLEHLTERNLETKNSRKNWLQ